MSSVSNSALLLLATALAAVAAAADHPVSGSPQPSAILRVCADPNNMPYSNLRGEGFENALAQLIAHELGRAVEYIWWPQRRGFLRNTLNAGSCDAVMGVPNGTPGVQTTRPYYRSMYVFVSRHDRRLFVDSLDDWQLRKLRIGVHVVGGNGDVPPAVALTSHGLAMNLRGYRIYGDYSRPSPASALLRAVADGEIDVAVIWGPMAGYFVDHDSQWLDMAPLPARFDTARTPMAYDISIAVRSGDSALRTQLDNALERRNADVRKLLLRFGVPMTAGSGSAERRTSLE